MYFGKIILAAFLSYSSLIHASEKMAPKPWSSSIPNTIANNVLYVPIMHSSVKNIPIKNIDEVMVDLQDLSHARIRPLASFDSKYQNSYSEFSKVRYSVYLKLLSMLEYLPDNVGIAYFEGLRPLYKQKEYFDKKFKEILTSEKNKEKAYEETCKHVSPFIQNIPTHATGAAIDMTLFERRDGKDQLLDMGQFDVIFGPNNQQDTFSEKTNEIQRKNRLLLLEVASQVGLLNNGF